MLTLPRRRLGSLLAKTLATASVIAATAAAAHAAPVRVRVRGAATLAARATREQVLTDRADERVSELVFSGTLADDARQPLAAETVTIRVAREVEPRDARVAEALRQARGCDGGAARITGPSDAPEIAVVTDEAGRFCFRARLDPDRYTAHLAFAGSGLVDGATKELRFDLGRRGLALRFDPTPGIVQLDTAQTALDLVALVDPVERDDGAHVAPGLAVALANETEQIGHAVTDASGRARFVVPGVKLGPPGPGEVRASFAGDAETAPASDAQPVERHAKVTIRVPAAERGELTAAVPEDGIGLVAEVTTSFGSAPEGTVEARIGDITVGAAPVERGIARLTLTFAAEGADALVKLRYVPASPWYEPAGEPTIRVPIRAPSLAEKLPMLAAGLAVLAFFLLGRVAGQKRRPAPAPVQRDREREGKPRIEVVRATERDQGWSGRVVDAHDDVPVRSARVWIERGTFEGRSVLASVETDENGEFSIASIGAIHGDETIASEARLHARHMQPLPGAGEIVIALAQRRRALLAGLVAWARRRGPPFDTRPEPTPGHVRRAASDEPEAARWADAVENAAFGPGEIDARAEQDVARLAPPDPRPDPATRPS